MHERRSPTIRRCSVRPEERLLSLASHLLNMFAALWARDLGSLRPRKADISILFDLIDEGPETNIARDKDKMIGDAVWDEHRHKTTRTRAHVRLKTKE